MKKIVIVAVLLILVICLAPFPQFIEKSYSGVNTYSGESADISLDVTYLRFLFLKDKMYGDIKVTCDNETVVYGSSMFYVGKWPADNADKAVHAFSGFYFNPETIMHDYGDGIIGSKVVGSEIANAYISPDFSKILLYHEPSEESEKPSPRQYVGNVNQNKEEETAEYFAGFLH